MVVIHSSRASILSELRSAGKWQYKPSAEGWSQMGRRETQMSIWLHTASRKRLRDGNRGALGCTWEGPAQGTPVHEHSLKVAAGRGGLSGSSSAMNSIDPKETDATQDPGHCHEQDGLFHMLHLLCLQGSHYSALASKFLSSKYFHLCTIFISERINTQRGEKQTNKKGALQQFFLFNCLNLFGSFN